MARLIPRRGVLLHAALAALAVCPLPVFAQGTWPARAVTIVVPFPPGGGTDTGARLVAQKLSLRWGQPVVIDNKPGAAGVVGVDFVSKAKPDGYTLLMGNIGTQSINPSLYKKLPYNADSAFVPVTLVAELPLVLLVNPGVKAGNVKELVALAKADPGKLSYSTSGAGGSMHLTGEMFETSSGTKILHVPYKGGGPAISDLIAGHVQMSFATILESSGHIRSGKLRAIAVTGATRSPALPEVPTVAESGVPGYESASWIGLLAPAGTPRDIVDKLAADVKEVLAAPDVNQQLLAQGATPAGTTPAQFSTLIDNDRKRYARIIQEKRITVD
ncbi:MAG: tripartite tricarboxylate transporter substrate binding protein [Burkholderiales bacterium]|nr:tripartite tricarboxylate transporter substrate binding protein [Burkholderiales bacterium]